MRKIIFAILLASWALGQTYIGTHNKKFDFSDPGVIKVDGKSYDASTDVFNKFTKGGKILEVNVLTWEDGYKEITFLSKVGMTYYAVYLRSEGNMGFSPQDYIEIPAENVKKIAFVEGDYIWVLKKPVYGKEFGGKITGYLLTQYVSQRKENTYGTVVDRVIRKHDPVFITDAADDFGFAPGSRKIYIQFHGHYRWVELKTPRDGISLIGKDVERDGYDRRMYYYQLIETTPPDQD
jgi:hypothetical protein